jgi:vacuolar-type H+-ATPase subunit E/Vma4
MIKLLEALIALPTIGIEIEKLISTICAWWLSRQQEKTYQHIIDAAALSAKAKNHEDRIKALEAWRSALSRPRFLP